jgi:predicted membrane metal-binding protein
MQASSSRTITQWSFGWCAGIVAAVVSPGLPSPVAGLSACLFVLGVAGWWRWHAVAAAALGVAYALAFAHGSLQERLDPCLDGAYALVTGTVVGLPQPGPRQSRFEVRVEDFETRTACDGRTPRKLRVTWFQGEDVLPGERWRLLVTLRAPRGLVNPGGFDYEQWLLVNGVDGTGSVQQGRRADVPPRAAWTRWRFQMRATVQGLDLAHGSVLLALRTGDGGLMPDADVAGYPTSRYEIWYSEQGWRLGVEVHARPVWPVTPSLDTGTGIGERVTGWATEFVFGGVRLLVDAATWLITWAYSFRFAANLAEPASQLAAP